MVAVVGTPSARWNVVCAGESQVLHASGWWCRACVPHEPVALGELMCLRGDQRDGKIYGRGWRMASIGPVLPQGEPPGKRPKDAGCAPACIGGHGGLAVWGLQHEYNDVYAHAEGEET